MADLRARLERYLFSEISLLPVIVFRIGIGAIFLLSYIQLAPRFMAIFSPSGLGGVVGCAEWLPERSYWALYALIILAALGTLVGFYTRTCLAILLAAHSAMLVSSSIAFWGWGFIIRHFVLFLMFCSPGMYFSMDNRLLPPEKRIASMPRVPAFPLRMIQVQICLIYFVCCVNRLDEPTWWLGKSLHRALSYGLIGRFPFVDWYGLYPLLAPLSMLGLFLEILGSLLIFLGRLQKWAALGLILLHLTLESTVMLQYWQLLMISGLLTFLPERWLNSPARKAGRPARNLKRTLAAGAFLIFWGAVLATSVPERFSPNAARGVQNAASAVLMKLTLDATRFMNVFQSPQRTLSSCFFSLGLRGDKTSRMLYATPLDYCQSSGIRFFNDSYDATLYRIAEFEPSVCPLSPEEIRARLGELYCRKSKETGEPADRVLVGAMTETMVNQREYSDTGDLRWELEIVTAYDCRGKTAIADPAQEILRTLRRDHPGYLDKFKRHPIVESPIHREQQTGIRIP